MYFNQEIETMLCENLDALIDDQANYIVNQLTITLTSTGSGFLSTDYKQLILTHIKTLWNCQSYRAVPSARTSFHRLQILSLKVSIGRTYLPSAEQSCTSVVSKWFFFLNGTNVGGYAGKYAGIFISQYFGAGDRGCLCIL